jgi:predicted dehydrogenase
MTEAYSLTASVAADIPAPVLPYEPPMPQGRLPIGLVGAGGISAAHLDAYRTAGFDVRVICNRTLSRAVERRDAFFPQAEATDDIAATLSRPDIAVLDITPHPAERTPLIEAALLSGKHVLSQKPFVLDLDTGARLCDLAEDKGLVLAVNQNGRWSPHMSYMREAVRAGLIGQVQSVHLSVHWDHSWIRGTSFERIEDLILYDFAIHWFDFLTSLIGPAATNVMATRARAGGQDVAAPLLSQTIVEFPGGQAALLFDAATRFGPQDRSIITGTLGTLAAHGPDLGHQTVTLATAAGLARPALTGTWFNDGFRGTMGALLCAAETGQPPLNGARANLDSLALAFAAIAAARRGTAVRPGSIRSLAQAQS